MPGSTAIPCLRYRNAPAAIEFLCQVLGFEKQLVVPGPDDTIMHSQLKLGGGMIMVGSVKETDFGKHMIQPDECGGRETQSVCLVVPDADAVHAKAVAKGWKILMPIRDQDYGGRGFGCSDPEGHIWYVGTYDPWK